MNTKFLFTILMIFSMAACQQSAENSSENAIASYDDAPTTQRQDIAEEGYNKRPAPTFERKLIKNGFIQFETNNLDSTHVKISKAVEKFKGYISTDEAQTEYYRNSHSLEIRIPAVDFDKFISEITSGIAHFDERNIAVQDVTAQFVDLEARLKTKKELESRYIELLAKAKNVTEILEIEREIANLRSDIEAMEGRFRVMKNQIALSTLTIQYYTVNETQSEMGLIDKLGKGFVNGWDNLMGFIVGLVNIWPFLILLSLIAIFVKRWWRKRAAK